MFAQLSAALVQNFARGRAKLYALDRRYLLAAVFVVFAAAALAVPTAFIHAEAAKQDGGAFDAVTSFLAGMLNAILGLIISFIGKLLLKVVEVIIIVGQYNGFVDSPAVANGWIITRDFANMMFVAVMIIYSFGTILGIEGYSYKNKTIVKLLIMAVVINFTRTICGLMIDAGQVFMMTFVNGFKAAAGGNFVKAFGIEALMNPSQELNAKGEAEKVNQVSLVPAMLLALVFVSMALGVCIIIVATLVARIVWLWVLVVLSPLAFMMRIVPGGKASAYYGKWWSLFTANVITGPVTAFFLWLALMTVASNNLTAGFPVDQSLEKAAPSISQAFEVNTILKFIIALALLQGGIQVSQELGGAGAKAGANYAKKLGDFTKSKIKGAASGAAKGIYRFSGAEERVGGLKQAWSDRQRTKEDEFKDKVRARSGLYGARMATVDEKLQKGKQAVGAVVGKPLSSAVGAVKGVVGDSAERQKSLADRAGLLEQRSKDYLNKQTKGSGKVDDLSAKDKKEYGRLSKVASQTRNKSEQMGQRMQTGQDAAKEHEAKADEYRKQAEAVMPERAKAITAEDDTKRESLKQKGQEAGKRADEMFKESGGNVANMNPERRAEYDKLMKESRVAENFEEKRKRRPDLSEADQDRVETARGNIDGAKARLAFYDKKKDDGTPLSPMEEEEYKAQQQMVENNQRTITGVENQDRARAAELTTKAAQETALADQSKAKKEPKSGWDKATGIAKAIESPSEAMGKGGKWVGGKVKVGMEKLAGKVEGEMGAGPALGLQEFIRKGLGKGLRGAGSVAPGVGEALGAAAPYVAGAAVGGIGAVAAGAAYGTVPKGIEESGREGAQIARQYRKTADTGISRDANKERGKLEKEAAGGGKGDKFDSDNEAHIEKLIKKINDILGDNSSASRNEQRGAVMAIIENELVGREGLNIASTDQLGEKMQDLRPDRGIRQKFESYSQPSSLTPEAIQKAVAAGVAAAMKKPPTAGGSTDDLLRELAGNLNMGFALFNKNIMGVRDAIKGQPGMDLFVAAIDKRLGESAGASGAKAGITPPDISPPAPGAGGDKGTA